MARGDAPTRTRRRSSGRCTSAAGAVPLAGRLDPAGRGTGAPTSTDVDTFAHRPTAGTRGPLSWGAGGAPNGLARDLRRDEDAGPTYTSDPLDVPLEILGVPEVVVHLEVDAPVATLSVRLSDVAPDGSVALVSAGVLNLTHRRSHTRPGAAAARASSRRSACRSGPPAIDGCRVTASGSRSRRRCGRCCGRRRIRPRSGSIAGPPRRPRLELPVVPPAGGPGDAAVPAFRTEPPDLHWPAAEPLDGAGPAVAGPARSGASTRTSSPGRRRSMSTTAARRIVPDGRRLYAAETLRMTAWDADPARAELDAHVVYRWQEREAGRDGELTRIEIRADSRQTSTATDFDLAVRLEVDVDGVRFFER